MKFGNIHVRYHGFHPSEFTKSQVDSTLQEIYDESPDGSYLRASFSRKGDLLKGLIEVNSSAESFFASSVGRGLNEVTHRLSEQMRRRLNRWKAKRFQTRVRQEDSHDTSVA